MQNSNSGPMTNFFAWKNEKMNAIAQHITPHNVGVVLGANVMIGSALYFLQKDDADVLIEVREQETRRRTKNAHGYVLGSLAMLGASSYGIWFAKLTDRMDISNPCASVSLSLAAVVPLAVGTVAVDYHKNPTLKVALWSGLNVSIAACLTTMTLYAGPVMGQACLATGCVIGGLSLLASKKLPENLQKYEKSLGMGLGGLVTIGLGNLFFPISLLGNAALYTGVAAFGALQLVDGGRLARNSDFFDPINESLGIYADALNVFQKIALVLYELQKGGCKKEGGEDGSVK